MSSYVGGEEEELVIGRGYEGKFGGIGNILF